MIAVVAGTRPEIIKLAPVILALGDARVPFRFYLCGQHYDYEMSHLFLEELDLPKPDHELDVGNSSPASLVSSVLVKLSRFLLSERPALVLVQGDTNTTLSAALAGLKQDIPVGHVEAGLRSGDIRMPEEHNRRIVDHVSAHLFAPTENAKKNLVEEKVWGRIYVTGNTIIDAIEQYLPVAQKKSRILSMIPFREYMLATFHRSENVDDPEVLKGFVKVLVNSSVPTVFPVHPRTSRRLHEYGLWKELSLSKNVRVLGPVGYLDFLMLMKNCKFILTDSGGIQEEATAPAIAKRVIVARKSTERPEAVETGFAFITGVQASAILDAIRRASNNPNVGLHQTPFGNGRASEMIARTLSEIQADPLPIPAYV